MIARARHLDILPKTWMDEQELAESFEESGMFHEIAEENVRRISCLPFEARYIELEKRFGRLFQKTLEEEFPVVAAGMRQAIDVSENLGMNLFLDFCALHPAGEGQNETWYEDLRVALTAVQILAVQFAGRIAEQERVRC